MKPSLSPAATPVDTVVPATVLAIPSEESHFLRGALLMSACIGFFTANALLIKHAGTEHGVGTWSLVFLRGFIGLGFVMVWYGRPAGLRVSRVFTRPALVIRGLVGSLGLICYYWTIPRLGAGVATLVSNTYVVFGAVFAACFLVREQLTLHRFVWLLVSLSGVGLLTDARTGFDPAFGVALLGAVAAGFVIVIIRYLHRTEATPTIFAAQCVYAMIAVAPWAVPGLFRLTTVQLGWGILASFMATFGQLAMTHSFRYLNVSTGGAFHLTIPVWIAMGGFFLFDERLTVIQLTGAGLVLLGCLRAICR